MALKKSDYLTSDKPGRYQSDGTIAAHGKIGMTGHYLYVYYLILTSDIGLIK